MSDRFRAVRIASCAAALTYLGAAVSGNGGAQAQGAPAWTRWANFTSYDDYDCRPTQMDVVGQTSKLFSIPGGGPDVPAGTVMVSYSAECTKQGESPVTRTFYSYELPDGRRSPNFELASGDARNLHARSFASDPFFVGDYESNAAGNNPSRAFRYDLSTGAFLDLGIFPSARPFDASAANGVNMDGSVVVGESDLLAGGRRTTHAFRWTQALGLTDLTPLGHNGYNGYSSAYATSDAGDVAVGQVQVSDFSYRAFRWTLSDAATGAGTLSDLGPDSLVAYAVSGDGSVIGGQTSGLHAMRWTQATGVVDLGVLPGTTRSAVMAMSKDGAVMVGTSDNFVGQTARYGDNGAYGEESRAFRWTAATGIRDLNQLMTGAGVNMAGVVLRSATTVSENGQFIGGQAHFPGDANNQLSPYLIRYADATNGVATPSVGVVDPTTGANGGTSTNPTTPGNPTSPIAGITSLRSVQASVDSLAGTRRAIAEQQHMPAAVLLGENERIRAPNQAGPFATGGSVTGGSTARVNLGNDLTFLGGLSYGTQSSRPSRLTDVFLIAGKLRYLGDISHSQRLLFEVGGFWLPNGDYSFNRVYANGAGVASGFGRTGGEQTYVFGRAGFAADVGRRDEVALTGEVGWQAIRTDGYLETDSALNPFPATIAPGRDNATIGKVRFQWTHALTDRVDATVWSAAAHTLSVDSNLTAFVLGFGAINPARQTSTWAEYGGRVSYRLTDELSLGVMANAVNGTAFGGARFQVGADMRVGF